jgi:hypothetical protein
MAKRWSSLRSQSPPLLIQNSDNHPRKGEQCFATKDRASRGSPRHKCAAAPSPERTAPRLAKSVAYRKNSVAARLFRPTVPPKAVIRNLYLADNIAPHNPPYPMSIIDFHIVRPEKYYEKCQTFFLDFFLAGSK